MNTLKTSKITILTLLVVLGTLFTSCSKDDKEEVKEEVKEPSIIGTWLETSIKEDVYINGTLTDTSIENLTLEYASTLTIKSDNTFEMSYTEDDQVITFKGTYSINGNKLSSTLDGKTFIAEFNVNELNIIFEYTETVNGIQVRYVVTGTYSRQ